ncbi:MAG TPA: AMP-binding protein [Geobacteraceae bacterium]|nr:AMP-binding protein [Geobacteraceae bacterium]
MRTLIDLFETFAARGAKSAFVNRTGVRRIEFSYGAVHDLSLKMARLLADSGVEAGDRVLIWGPNSSWWGVAFWGTVLSGGVVVPVDFSSERDRAENIRSLTRAKLVIQSRYKAERMTASPALFLEDLQYLLENLEPACETARPAPDDMAQLIYTSGTTGSPKGVVLTHANLIANLEQINRQIPIITPAFTFLSLLPLSHMFEQMGGFFTPLYRGAAVVYPGALKPSAIMEALAEEDIYVIMAVPRLLQLLGSSIEREMEEKHLGALFRFLLRRGASFSPEARRLLFFPVQRKFGRNFTLFVSGGASLSPELFNFWQGLGFAVLEGYGLTECSPVLTVNTMEQQVAGAVGAALPGVELSIRGKEILARGANIFPGYYRNEEATRAAFTPDGWFRTGDMGEIGPDGWLTVKGREKELIVTGAGVNVYPDEIEDVLNGISGVRESCVIGIDRGRGEEVHAVLLLDGSGKSPGDIVAEANGKLDSLQRITGHTLWNEADFPKTTTLKIRKFLVKERICKGVEGQGTAVSGDRLVGLIAAVTGASIADVHEESLLIADLGLTSIGRLELVNYLEQEFRLDVDESRIGVGSRVRDLRLMLAKREKAPKGGHLRIWTNSTPVRLVRMAWDRIFNYPLFRCFVNLEIRRGENLEDLHGPVFFVANHLSYADQPSVMFALPRRIRYNTATAAKEEFFFRDFTNPGGRLWKHFTFEYGTWLLNLFPLPISQGFGGSLAFMGKLADRGVNILIFPEGTHSRDGAMQPFRLGLGLMVKALGIPLVPVRIRGTDRVLPAGARFPRRGRVTVTFGPLLRFRLEDAAEIVEVTRRAVEALE